MFHESAAVILVRSISAASCVYRPYRSCGRYRNDFLASGSNARFPSCRGLTSTVMDIGCHQPRDFKKYANSSLVSSYSPASTYRSQECREATALRSHQNLTGRPLFLD